MNILLGCRAPRHISDPILFMIINRVNPTVRRHSDQKNATDINYRVNTEQQMSLKWLNNNEVTFFSTSFDSQFRAIART